ncbi:MAG: TRAP transporter small permease [Bacillota bacterium]
MFFSGAQIFMRYVMNSSLAWSDELTRYSFVWSGFIAIGYAYRKNTTIRMDVVLNLLPKKLRCIIDIIVHLMCAALFVFLMKVSYDIVVKTAASGQVSSAVQLPMQFIYASPLVGFATTLIRLAQRIIKDLNALFHKDATGEEEVICQ